MRTKNIEEKTGKNKNKKLYFKYEEEEKVNKNNEKEEEERIREKKEFFDSSHNIKISKRRINKKLQIKKQFQ